MIKKIINITICVVLSLLAVLLALFLAWKYKTSWKTTTVGVEQSPDNQYSVIFQAVGEADWPFGPCHCKVTLKNGDRTVETFREDIYDDGGQFQTGNYSVEWMKYGVVITLKGCEQSDQEVEVFYDGRASFMGYTDEEIGAILKERYNIEKVDLIIKDETGYAVKADGIVFSADASLAFHDSYRQEVFKAVTDDLFPERFNRSLEWDVKEGDDLSDLVYTPIISINGYGNQDLNPFCDDICEWLDKCFERLPYDEAKEMYDKAGIIVTAYGCEKVEMSFASTLSLDSYTDDKVGFYNNLYTCVERYLNHEYYAFGGPIVSDESEDAAEESFSIDPEVSTEEIGDDVIRQWASYDYEVFYDFPDGSEYALVPVDRALGSSFYVLLSFDKKGDASSARLVNADPFNQQTGEAKFITFLDDGITGFAALTYSGGSLGNLFATFDGGESYQDITLPSPKIELPTGQVYNPFVMPEDAWEESGTIFVKMGQGPDGDHHSAELDGARTVGIYASTDGGKTFEFIREEAE